MLVNPAALCSVIFNAKLTPARGGSDSGCDFFSAPKTLHGTPLESNVVCLVQDGVDNSCL